MIALQAELAGDTEIVFKTIKFMSNGKCMIVFIAQIIRGRVLCVLFKSCYSAKEKRPMNKVKQMIVILFCAAVMVVVYFYYFYPTPIVKTFQSINASLAKLEKKSITIDGYTVNYYEGLSPKDKDTLVLLHGLGDDKNSFVLAAKRLSDQYHILLVDLLGHGENEKMAGLDYSVEGQAEMIRKFIQDKRIEKLYLGGNSMGGHIAAAYAARYQNTLKGLIIINAPGLIIDDHVAYNGFEDRTISEEELDSIMEKAFYKVPKLPKPLKVFKVNQMNESHDFLKYIVIPHIMNNKDCDLVNRVSSIHVPSLILWGKHDTIVKYNIAERYHKLIFDSKLVVIEDAAHCPQLETPDRVAAEIDIFIKETKSQFYDNKISGRFYYSVN